MPKKRPKKQLSPSEWRIMQACWSLGRTTIRDILMALSDRPPAMSYTTVHMLLTRIVEKGYLAVEQDRGVNYYTPAVDRESIVRLAAEDFVDNILAGEAANLEILDAVLEDRTSARPRRRKST
jgi:predicted transcriptional regulator